MFFYTRNKYCNSYNYSLLTVFDAVRMFFLHTGKNASKMLHTMRDA